MTKEEIITQGFLEAYLTQDLTPLEIQEVEQYIATDADVKMEYLNVQKTLELLAFHFGVTPSTLLKRRVMENSSVMNNAQLGSSAGSGWKLMMAASVLITMLSTFSAFYYWSKYKTTDARMTELVSQNLQMAENMTRVNLELDDVRNNLAVLISPEFSRIVLNGTANAQSAKAVIYWNADRQEVYLNSTSLGELPVGKQYQLWALVDGKPIDAGAFDPTGNTFTLMKEIARADAFAVTIEQTGGAESPSLETMQVYGAVSKG